jgi:hypothetical protein
VNVDAGISSTPAIAITTPRILKLISNLHLPIRDRTSPRF